MKKLLSVVLILVMLFSFQSVNAATNYCELFDKALGCLSFVDDYGNENTPWSANSICYITAQNIGFWDYYNQDKSDMEQGLFECYSVPDDKFTTLANKLFDVKVDLTTVNYDSTISIVYDPESATFDITTHNAGGGAFYHVYGYKQSGSVYSVYLQQSADGELYEEYALAKCKLNGEFVKIISCEKISSLPNIKTLTTWPKEPQEEPPVSQVVGTVSVITSSEPTVSTSTSSLPTSSEVSSNLSSEISSEVSSDVSSETTSDIKDIAEVQVLLDQKGLFISADIGVLPENTVMLATKIETAEGIEKLNHALENVAKTYIAYDVTATSNNVEIQPNGKVYATFDIPATFNLDKVRVVYVAEDGKFEELPCVVDKASEKVTAELSHFSTYAVIEATDDYLGTNDGGSIWAIVISIIVVLACAGVFAWYKLYYKKKLQKQEET